MESGVNIEFRHHISCLPMSEKDAPSLDWIYSMILSSKDLSKVRGFSALPWRTTWFRYCHMHSTVRAIWHEAWNENFFSSLGVPGPIGGCTTRFTMSISVVIGIESGPIPQLKPNQNSFVARHLKKRCEVDSMSDLHRGQHGSPFESLEKTLELVGSTPIPIRQTKVFNLSCNLHFHSFCHIGSGWDGHMWLCCNLWAELNWENTFWISNPYKFICYEGCWNEDLSNTIHLFLFLFFFLPAPSFLPNISQVITSLTSTTLLFVRFFFFF